MLSHFVRPCHRDDDTFGDDLGYNYNSCDYLLGYECLDPEVPNDCGTGSPTPSPAAASGLPGCEGPIYWIGDGFCDSSTNNEECAWDGGKTAIAATLNSSVTWRAQSSSITI